MHTIGLPHAASCLMTGHFHTVAPSFPSPVSIGTGGGDPDLLGHGAVVGWSDPGRPLYGGHRAATGLPSLVRLALWRPRMGGRVAGSRPLPSPAADDSSGADPRRPLSLAPRRRRGRRIQARPLSGAQSDLAMEPVKPDPRLGELISDGLT